VDKRTYVPESFSSSSPILFAFIIAICEHFLIDILRINKIRKMRDKSSLLVQPSTDSCNDYRQDTEGLLVNNDAVEH